jgi:hypothetical protein
MTQTSPFPWLASGQAFFCQASQNCIYLSGLKEANLAKCHGILELAQNKDNTLRPAIFIRLEQVRLAPQTATPCGAKAA